MSNRANRPSPSVSATLYDAGDRMRGNDGNMYQIIQSYKGTNRWSKLSRDSQYDVGGEVLHKVREPDQVIEMLEDTGLYQDFMSADTDELRYNIFENAEEIISKGVYAKGGSTNPISIYSDEVEEQLDCETEEICDDVIEKQEVKDEIVGSYNRGDETRSVAKRLNYKYFDEGGEIYDYEYQDDIYYMISDLTPAEYERFCDTYNIDPEDANEMSEFITDLEKKDADLLMSEIRLKSYKKGGEISESKLKKMLKDDDVNWSSDKEFFKIAKNRGFDYDDEKETFVSMETYNEGSYSDKEYAKGGEIIKSIDEFKKRGTSYVNVDGERMIDWEDDFTNYIYDRIDLDEQQKIRDDWNKKSRENRAKGIKGGKEMRWDEYLLKEVNKKSYAKGGVPYSKRFFDIVEYSKDGTIVRKIENKNTYEAEDIAFKLNNTNPVRSGYHYVKMEERFAKGGKVEKKGNEMIIGGLAGILLGIFFNK